MADSFVRSLRQNPTEAERLLWRQLRGKKIGDLRFRRQFRLGLYVVDFVSLPARLVIEVDGASHELTAEADERRTRWLEGQGFRVIRFTNDQIVDRLPDVVDTIAGVLAGGPTDLS
ncbi:endonuclease domain-containing protein [Inquilinus sp. Marseille-Q2685]|uniref:endonuclease domain-containing protein n=1 Tax=Inquilinus sp. Marseille-Q2685 TaxID=2866581 RepID=UPI001CE416A7|nr:endonuclease domain-containing protein [Inquilinus sp. Marseille-Q2685]